MPEDFETLSAPQEKRVVCYMSRPLYDELERRSETGEEECDNRSKVIRKALREYFRRHPKKEKLTS